MVDTYDSKAEAAADRQQQQALLTALDSSGRALRRDECGAWCIFGARGKAYTWGDGKSWVLWVGCRSARQCGFTKKRLRFCTVTQDGDEEGCLRLLRLPTAEQAGVIRELLGIRRRRHVSAAERERLVAIGFEHNTRTEASSAPRTAKPKRLATPVA